MDQQYYKRGASLDITVVDNGFIVDAGTPTDSERLVVTSVQELVNLMILKLTNTDEQLEKEQVDKLREENRMLKGMINDAKKAKQNTAEVSQLHPASDPENELEG